MRVAGIDIGSVAAKCLILEAGSGAVPGRAVPPTGWNSREAGETALARACAEAGIAPEALSAVVGTGYGRVSLPFATKTVTEISCHARGAAHLFPATGIILEFGGQDSKVISLDPAASGGRSGNLVRDFIMNDKCAAGTGRREIPAALPRSSGSFPG